MRFFALSWAVLLPFYALQPYLDLKLQLPWSSPALNLIAEFLPTYSGVLLLQAAEPLWREATHYFPSKLRFLHWIDQITERSLYLLVLPHAILFISGHDEQLFIRLLNFVLGVVAFIFIGTALRILTSGGFWRSCVWWGFVLVTVTYSVAQGVWTYKLLAFHVNMTPRDIVSFAICKVVFSGLFLGLVMCIPSRESEQNQIKSYDEAYERGSHPLAVRTRRASSSIRIPLPFATAAIGLFLSYIFPAKIAPVQATVIGFGLGILLLYAAGRFEGKSSIGPTANDLKEHDHHA